MEDFIEDIAGVLERLPAQEIDFTPHGSGRRLTFTVAIDGVRSVYHGECRPRRLEAQVHEF